MKTFKNQKNYRKIIWELTEFWIFNVDFYIVIGFFLDIFLISMIFFEEGKGKFFLRVCFSKKNMPLFLGKNESATCQI